jgi:hypothetical protein
MSDPEREQVEITSRFALRETALSASLLIGASVVQFLKTHLFPDGVPVATDAVLFLGELTMVGLALRHAARVFVGLLPLSKSPLRIGKLLRTADRIGPAGWGVICALVFLAVAAFSFITVGAPGWVYAALWLFAVVLWVGAIARAATVSGMFIKGGITFITIPAVLAQLAVMLIVIAFILNTAFGGGITARSILQWIASRGTT